MRNRNKVQNGLDWQPETSEQVMADQPANSDVWTGLIHPRAMLAFFKRRFTTILLVASLVFGLGMVGYMLLGASYSAQTLILVDPRQPKVTLSEDVLPSIGGDAAALTSLVQIMSSDGFLAKAVQALELSKDPDYASASSEKALIDAFRKNMGAQRQGATYIVEVNVTSSDPKRAAQHANGLANLFVSELNGNRLSASTEAAEWLSQRLTLLRRNLKNSENAVAAYQGKAGIVDTGNQNTLDSQQLSSLVAQMAAATTELEDAKARFEQAKRDGVPASSNGQSDQFLNYNQLLQEQSRLRRQAAEMNQTLGARHPRVLANKEQQRIIASQVQSEKKRLVQQAGQAYKAAKSKKASVERQLADARSRAINQNKQSVELANLEREAKANRDLYEQFLARYKITEEQSRLQSDEAKIASSATVPLKSNKPSIKLVVPVLAILGGVAGLVVALLLEAFASPSSPPLHAPAAPMTNAALAQRATRKSAANATHPEAIAAEDHYEDQVARANQAFLQRSQQNQTDILPENGLSPRRKAALKRQMAQQRTDEDMQQNALRKSGLKALDLQQAGFERDEIAAYHHDHGGDSSQSHLAAHDEFDDLDPQEFYDEEPPRINRPSSRRSGGEKLRSRLRQPHMLQSRPQRAGKATYPSRSMRDLASASRHPMDEDYGENVHALYPSHGGGRQDVILFSIPESLYGKLHQPNRFEDSTIRNLADNVLRRNVELSSLLKDNFNHIDSFLRCSNHAATRSVLVTSLNNEQAQDVTADLLKDYAIQMGIRPVLVTLANQPGSFSEQDWQQEGPLSGLVEYEAFDVINFSARQAWMQDGRQDDHWGTNALESKNFSHLVELCKRNYGLVIIVAPGDIPHNEMDILVDHFDSTILVLDEPDLDREELSEWQDWARQAEAALVLDQSYG